MKILAIETSCDETGIAILATPASEEASARQGSIILMGNALASQIALHAQYGGVFPAMAKRAHAEKIVPLIMDCLRQAGLLNTSTGDTVGVALRETILSICNREDEMVNDFVQLFTTYEKPDIDYIAVTVGPGLEPALWVGINAAKVLSTVWNIPVIPVNHMEGHVVTAAVIEKETKEYDDARVSGERLARTKDREYRHILSSPTMKEYVFQDLQFPLLALLVSGGHTELVLVKNYGDYEKIGQTRDDAVGEAFDKVARMLGLPYPGGPAVSKMAREFRTLIIESSTDGASPLSQFVLPRPMLHSGDYDFSFSGLKTAMLYTIRDLCAPSVASPSGRALAGEERLALAAAFEDAAIEVLVKKTIRAAQEFHIQTIVVGGGVAGNTYLREQLTAHLGAQLLSATALFPEPWLATDNAVMIGLAACARIMNGTMQTQPSTTLRANGNLSITQ
jgi:N6-L-threonylcarbamoyladenine synthase